MKLQTKFTIYNAISKIIIILILVVVLPLIVKHVVFIDTDKDLEAKKDQVLQIIQENGITTFIEEGSEFGYGSYNLLKEEFISLEQVNPQEWKNGIENSERLVENEIVNYRVLSHVFEVDGTYFLLEVGRSLATVHAIEDILQNFSIYILLAIIIIATVSDIAFTQILLKPLIQIIVKLKDIKDPSTFQFEKISTSTDDFKYLDNTINEMMYRIEGAFSKEKEFISNVSHELLTPVSIIQSKLENMLINSDLSDDNILKIIEAQKTLSRLRNIVKALLLISKIENEQFLKLDQIHLSKMVEEVAEEIKERLEVKEIVLVKDLKDEIILKNCNKDLLFNLLFNLFNNSIKYNKEKGRIFVKIFSINTLHVLEIRDEGTGMDPHQIPNIFNRFKRLHKEENESYGLGLPIVKTIADFHKIKIEVSSVPEKGTSFKLFFEDVNVQHLPSPKEEDTILQLT